MASPPSEAAPVCAPEARQNLGVLHAAQSAVHRSWTGPSLKQLKSVRQRRAKFWWPSCTKTMDSPPSEAAQVWAPEARQNFGVLHAVQSVYTVYTDHGQLPP